MIKLRVELYGRVVMSNEKAGTEAIRNYLLGDLPESETEKIERWYFADGQGVDELWAVFGEIAEEYLNGALSEIESRRFDQRLRSTPGLRKMFENEKALFDYAAKAAAGNLPRVEADESIAKAGWRRPYAAFFKPARFAIAGVMALAAVITWFALKPREGAKPVSPEGSRQTMAKDQTSPDGVARPSVDPRRLPQPGRGAKKISPGLTATFLLSATRVREEQSDPILEIPAQTDIVQLELELPAGDCPLFSAVLHAESDETLQRWDNLRARRDHSTPRATPRIVIRARADALKNAGYVVNLDCVSRHNNSIFSEQYRFKVEKKRLVQIFRGKFPTR